MRVEDAKAGTASSYVVLMHHCIPLFHVSCAACSITVEQLVPALKGMTSLSTLQLSTLESVAPLALLPTSLVALHLAVITPEIDTDGSDDDTTYDRQPAVPEVVQMSYLTQCTSLTGGYWGYGTQHMAEPAIIQESEQAPGVAVCVCAP